MDIATGAMNTLLPKLVDLVMGEYRLQKGVSKEIKELEKELESMNAALRHLTEMPPDQLDELTKIWASDVRELSYDIEDNVDTFMLRCNKGYGEHTKLFSISGLIGKLTYLYSKAKTNHQIHNIIKDIMVQAKIISERRDSITQNPEIKKVFKKMLHQLDEKKYGFINDEWDEVDLINKIREFLGTRRYLSILHLLFLLK
nr:unnamed protein product [Digitaria exilis]